MTLDMAICWTLVLIIDIIYAVSGAAPTWVAVFCPLSIPVLDCWVDYIDERINKRR